MDKRHDERAMLDIAEQAHDMAGALCLEYGQCEYHTALTVFRFWLEKMEDAIDRLEDEADSDEGWERASDLRYEVGAILRDAADIIEKEDEE